MSYNKYLNLALIRIIDIEKNRPEKDEVFEYIDDVEIKFYHKSKKYFVNFYYDGVDILVDFSIDNFVYIDFSIFENNKWKTKMDIDLKDYKIYEYYDIENDEYISIDDYDTYDIVPNLTNEQKLYLKLKYKNIGDILD